MTHNYMVEYWYGTYHGFHSISAEDEETAVAKFWAMMSRHGLLTLPMAYQRAIARLA